MRGSFAGVVRCHVGDLAAMITVQVIFIWVSRLIGATGEWQSRCSDLDWIGYREIRRLLFWNQLNLGEHDGVCVCEEAIEDMCKLN